MKRNNLRRKTDQICTHADQRRAPLDQGRPDNRRDGADQLCRGSVHLRRGSTYAIVLMASLIVVSIGLSSLASVRIQARIAQAGSDTGSAKRLAMAGIEYGLLYLNQDTTWRTKLADAGWSGRVRVAGGDFTTTATDPTDADLLDNASDPVVIRSVGEVGTHRHLLEARFEMEPADAAINTAIFSAGSIAITNATVGADAELHAAGNVAGFASNINTNVSAAGTISGSTYNGTTRPGVDPLVAPSNATALAYYLSNGTAIPYSSLPYKEPNQVSNSTIDTNSTGWTGFSCTVSHSTTVSRTGAGSLLVSNRDSRWDGADHSVGSQIINGESYISEAWIRTDPTQLLQEFYINTYLQLSIFGTKKVQSTRLVVPADGNWYRYQSTDVVSWDPVNHGNLTGAFIRVETGKGDDKFNFWVDDVSYKHICGTCSTKYLSGELLTPSNNPFGSTNGQGIYIIDCANQNIIIENSRINGTLVLRNPGTGSEIRGSMNMEAAVSNYPTLMVDGFIKVNTTTAPLSEATAGRNFNPSGSEYPRSGGTSDADTADTYPSHFKGMVFATGGFTFNNAAAVNGSIITNASTTFDNVNLTVTYDEKIKETPPPGFTDIPYRPVFVPGSFKRIVE